MLQRYSAVIIKRMAHKAHSMEEQLGLRGVFGAMCLLAALALSLSSLAASSLASRDEMCDAGPLLGIAPKNATGIAGGISTFNVTIKDNNSFLLCEGMHIRLQLQSDSAYLTEYHPGGNWTNYTIQSRETINASVLLKMNSSAPPGTYSFKYRALLDNETYFDSGQAYYFVTAQTAALKPSIVIDNVSWHCYSGKVNRGQYCRPEDQLAIDAINFRNAGEREYNGTFKLLAYNNYGLATNRLIDTYTEQIEHFQPNSTYSFELFKKFGTQTGFISNVSSTYTIPITYEAFPPDSDTRDNHYDLVITTQFYKGCDYNFPPCPEGFACAKNLCTRANPSVTPRPVANISAPSALPTATALPTTENLTPISTRAPTPPPSLEAVGGACTTEIDCESGNCKDGRCAPEPSKGWLEWFFAIIHSMARAIGLQ